MTKPTCPECSAPAMADPVPLLRFQHEPTCSLLADLDRRRAADVFDLIVVRPATEAELALLSAHGWPSDDLAPAPAASGAPDGSQVTGDTATGSARVIAYVAPGPLWQRRFRLVNANGDVISVWPEQSEQEDDW